MTPDSNSSTILAIRSCRSSGAAWRRRSTVGTRDGRTGRGRRRTRRPSGSPPARWRRRRPSPLAADLRGRARRARGRPRPTGSRAAKRRRRESRGLRRALRRRHAPVSRRWFRRRDAGSWRPIRRPGRTGPGRTPAPDRRPLRRRRTPALTVRLSQRAIRGAARGIRLVPPGRFELPTPALGRVKEEEPGRIRLRHNGFEMARYLSVRVVLGPWVPLGYFRLVWLAQVPRRSKVGHQLRLEGDRIVDWMHPQGRVVATHEGLSAQPIEPAVGCSAPGEAVAWIDHGIPTSSPTPCQRVPARPICRSESRWSNTA